MSQSNSLYVANIDCKQGFELSLQCTWMIEDFIIKFIFTFYFELKTALYISKVGCYNLLLFKLVPYWFEDLNINLLYCLTVKIFYKILCFK